MKRVLVKMLAIAILTMMLAAGPALASGQGHRRMTEVPPITTL